MRKKITLLLFFTLLAKAEPPLLDEGEKQNLFKLPSSFDLLKVDPKYSSGTLTLKAAGKKATLTFGPEEEFIGVGFIFRPEFLPLSYRKNFSDTRILQILFLKKGETLPFLSVMLQAENFKSPQQSFKVSMEANEKKRAWLMVESPTPKENQSNEEKLKNNFFGSQGIIKTQFVAKPSQTQVLLSEKEYPFQLQRLSLSFNTILSTPFNPTKGELSGKVTIPVLWTEEPSSMKQLAKVFSENSPQEKSTKSKQEAIQQHKREVSGSTRDKK